MLIKIPFLSWAARKDRKMSQVLDPSMQNMSDPAPCCDVMAVALQDGSDKEAYGPVAGWEGGAVFIGFKFA